MNVTDSSDKPARAGLAVEEGAGWGRREDSLQSADPQPTDQVSWGAGPEPSAPVAAEVGCPKSPGTCLSLRGHSGIPRLTQAVQSAQRAISLPATSATEGDAPRATGTDGEEAMEEVARRPPSTLGAHRGCPLSRAGRTADGGGSSSPTPSSGEGARPMSNSVRAALPDGAPSPLQRRF